MSSVVDVPAGIDKDVWETMTEEEREGIAGSEYTAQELDTIKRLASNAVSDDDSDDETANDDDSTNEPEKAEDPAAPDAADKPLDPAAEDAAVTTEPVAQVQAQEPQAVARYEARLPDDFSDRVEALASAEASAWSEFNDGKLDQTELQSKLSAIANDRVELNALKIKADISQEMSAQSSQQLWLATVQRSMNDFAKPENGGIDYRKDEAKAADLDQFVKLLANNNANANKPMEWFLTEAHRRVQALYGIAPALKKETIADATERRKPVVSNAPKTLAHVPGSDGPGDIGSEFADIDNLAGDALEDAIRRMSPEQRERFAMGR